MSLRRLALSIGGLAIPIATADQFIFEDVTASAGLDYTQIEPRPGASVVDYNQDGYYDVCFFGGLAIGPRLYRNNGDGSFTNVTKSVLPKAKFDTSHGIFGDMDNDGDADLVLARRYKSWLDTGMAYYENAGGYFLPVAITPNVARDPTSLGALALGDLDMDGDLDVVFSHNGGNGIGGPAFIVRNDGPGAFIDASVDFGGGISLILRHWTAVVADFNNDNMVDIHSAVDFKEDFQCRNMGNGTFMDVSEAAGVTNAGSDMGIAVGDIENDGDLDIYSTNIQQGVLYLNNGAGVFRDRANPRGLASFPGVGWGAAFFDLDHDRDQDLVFVSQNQPGFVYENDGNGFFTNLTAGSGLYLDGHSLLPFDFDLDGDTDLMVIDIEGTPQLFENKTPALANRHWLVVRPRGTQSNRDGVGARVEVTIGELTQTRVIMAGYSFFNGPPMEAHFGLGAAAVADRVTVTFPSGRSLTAEGVVGDRYIEIVEPSGAEDGDVGGGDAGGDETP